MVNITNLEAMIKVRGLIMSCNLPEVLDVDFKIYDGGLLVVVLVDASPHKEWQDGNFLVIYSEHDLMVLLEELEAEVK